MEPKAEITKDMIIGGAIGAIVGFLIDLWVGPDTVGGHVVILGFCVILGCVGGVAIGKLFDSD